MVEEGLMTLAECIERNLADRERELAQSTTETPASPQLPSPRAVEASRAPETSAENLPAVRSGSGLSPVVPDAHQRARQLQARRRTQEALALRRQGWSQGQIAEHQGISQQAVSKMLRKADQKALRAMERDVGLVKLRQSERLDELYLELMFAWRDGQNDRTLTRKRDRGADGFEDTTERRSGKPDPGTWI
jgi:hypothetical protein